MKEEKRIMSVLTANLFSILIGVVSSLLFFGCSSSPSELKITNIPVAQPTGTLTGKIIDGATRAPIGGANLALIVNGTKLTTTSSSATDPDLTGTFAFSGLPVGMHTLKIVAANYAVIQVLANVGSWKDDNPGQTYDNTPFTTNMGLIPLGKAVDLMVVTTANGQAVPGVTVFAEPEKVSKDCSKTTFSGTTIPIFDASDHEHEISTTTDTAGKAILTGLNQCIQYFIVAAPHDGNGDGMYDHITSFVLFEATHSDKTLALALQPAQRNDGIAKVAASTDPHKRAEFDALNITDSGFTGIPGTSFPNIPSTGTDDPIKMVFNFPVSLSEGITVTFVNDLINPDADNNNSIDTTFSERKPLAVTAALDPTGTILTITPPAGGFPKNEIITLTGSVTSTIGGFINSRLLDDDFYITDDTASGLSATTILTADNYNGSTATTTTTSAFTYLEFPEYVTGTIHLISVTGVGTTTAETIDEIIQVNPDDGEMVFTDGTLTPSCFDCGTGAGIFYRVGIGEFFANGEKIKVAVDVTDVEGNHFNKVVELTVQ